MPAITATITVRLPECLLGRVDGTAAELGLSRNAFMVQVLGAYFDDRQERAGAVERALEGLALGKGGEHESATATPPSTPAEQPKVVYTDDPAAAREEFPDAKVWPSERALRGTPQVREFTPYPKGGKR